MDNNELCEALFDAFSRGDEQRVRALCTPDMQAKQNNNPPMNLEALLGFSRSVLRVVDDFRYEDAKRSEVKAQAQAKRAEDALKLAKDNETKAKKSADAGGSK